MTLSSNIMIWLFHRLLIPRLSSLELISIWALSCGFRYSDLIFVHRSSMFCVALSGCQQPVFLLRITSSVPDSQLLRCIFVLHGLMRGVTTLLSVFDDIYQLPPTEAHPALPLSPLCRAPIPFFPALSISTQTVNDHF
ncbi:hypothetical protein GYMLUDRAFT_70864 [Collybiopsis luxurians FD-317 M1]|nr:hypothetical protein GYMLUDRAFT_70864 [Collybiopsis luxurians FD-317 M1]